MTEGAELLFMCPRCGGHKYGTTAPSLGSTVAGNVEDARRLFDRVAVGHCHSRGADGRLCGFTWNRRDDARYFRPADEKG